MVSGNCGYDSLHKVSGIELTARSLKDKIFELEEKMIDDDNALGPEYSSFVKKFKEVPPNLSVTLTYSEKVAQRKQDTE